MKLVIGVTDYELKLTDEVVHSEDEVCGTQDWVHGEIKISTKTPSQTRLQTFWHEVVHAILDEIGAGELNNDEGFVDAFGKQIYGVMKRNKIDKLYEYVGGKDERIDKKNPS